MAVIKCKMCGGDLNLIEGASTAECEFCGSIQTIPKVDDEKKLTLFARANRLRAACEFDKAAGIYESIVADFPEEAEAYWGLVLCKYGIEYVDDPATGKKIPTCHRSSFDSIMDDGNFEQAMENADAAALRVYREEAKQIEEIRKGILTVSSNEQPYDIFICYKETDSNGDRTVDSLLAQNIYDALTERKYRVFFSRITLEDKLGQAYEPYIFAALNSAKIMLAVGTCYEHYNAVWVKNEWSRYLKIIAQDKNKYLIPCYKNIDAYDIPKEFAHLQGQDMGKVGAIQDLLRGIEKILPKAAPVTVVQEKVVVGNSGGNNKIASLLDRGNMALEDGDWAKADSFFEDVLNNDSKNAQAYIGKTLALEKCRTMDALKRKRLESYPTPKSEILYIPERTAHVREIVAQYGLPGYVEESTIRKLYEFDRSYESLVSGRQKQYREEELWWENHRQLSRGEKFASGPVAENIKAEKQHLFSQIAERVKKAQEADARAVAKLEAVYDAHIAEADTKAEQLYNDGVAYREKDYANWLQTVKSSENLDLLKKAEQFFKSQRDYKDSKNLAEHCCKRIADITAEQNRKEAARQAAEAAEKERQRIAEEKALEAAMKKKKLIAILAVFMLAMIGAAALYVTKSVIPSKNYKNAELLLAQNDYSMAAEAFTALGDYKDSVEAHQYAVANYFIVCAKKLDDTGLPLLKKWADNMQTEKSESTNSELLGPSLTAVSDQELLSMLEDFDVFFESVDIMSSEMVEEYFAALWGYSVTDADYERIYQLYTYGTVFYQPVSFSLASDLKMAQEYLDCAETILRSLGNYRDCTEIADSIADSWIQLLDARYEEAMHYMTAEDYSAAQLSFASLNGYRDSADWADNAKNATIYAYAKQEMDAGNYKLAVELFTTLADYKDSAVMLKTAKQMQRLHPNVGDVISIGAYEQDNDMDNGKEAIEWIVLEVNDGKTLLISKYGLDSRAYNESRTSVTWENCTLRRWLNNDFIQAAFEDEERKIILTTDVTEGFNVSDYITKDKIFLLSYEEAKKFFPLDNNRICKVSSYAKGQGAVTSDGNCYWWLRSRGADKDYAANVRLDGMVSSGGSYVHIAQYAVRPAMWIDIGTGFDAVG